MSKIHCSLEVVAEPARKSLRVGPCEVTGFTEVEFISDLSLQLLISMAIEMLSCSFNID